MAPIKFEENLKERLEKRTLEPSSSSWDVLSQRLDNEEKKGGKRGYFWLAIAASIIGLSFIVYPFLSNEINLPEGNKEFVSDTNENEEKIEDKTTNKLEIQQEILKEEVVDNKIKNTKQKEPNIEQNKTQYLANYKAELPEVVQERQDVNNAQNSIKKDIAIATENTNNNKVSQKLIALNKNAKTVLNDNTSIDSLLASAQQDIASNREHTNVRIPIDHNSLLQDVEDDLEERFRDKLLNTVRKGYSSIKQEIAERND